MKSLHTLLKVAQRRMDELGVEVVRIGQEIEELRGKQAVMRAGEQAELANAAREPMFAAMLPAYRLRVKWQLDEVEAQVSVKNAVLSDVRERLSEAYIEKSKFEQLIEQERVRVETDRAAKEQAMLDEVAINRAGSSGK